MQLLLMVGDFLALFTGDAGWDQVLQTMEGIKGLDLLKIPHHGSRKGFPPAGLGEAMRRMRKSGEPVVLCPSYVPGVRYLPAPEVVDWFETRGIKLVYTGDKSVNIRYKRGRLYGNESTVVDNNGGF